MIVDGYSLENYFKAIPLENNYAQIFEYPSLKSPQKNDWAEYNGIEVDLTAPVLDRKFVVLKFVITSTEADGFLAFLKSVVVRVWNLEEINFILDLRFISANELARSNSKTTISIKLEVNNVDALISNYQAPNLNVYSYGFGFDGVYDFGHYGITPLIGSSDSLEQSVELKSGLEIESDFRSGALVYPMQSKTKDFKATLYLLLKCNESDFYRNYYAFLHDLIVPNARELQANGTIYECYYESSKIKEFIFIDGVIFCHFEINLIMI